MFKGNYVKVEDDSCEDVFSFECQELPYCCGVLVIGSLECDLYGRAKVTAKHLAGFEKQLNEKVDLDQYHMVQATVNFEQKREKKFLLAAGFVELAEFPSNEGNGRANQKVWLLGRSLVKE